MKIFILFLSMSFSLAISAQKADRQGESKADTIVTKDPLDPNREYWVIHNIKGNLRAQGFMTNGKKDGVWRDYNDITGVMSKLTEYKNGIQNGASVSFNNSGVIQVDETFMGDKKNGQLSSYGNYGGRLKLIENYRDGNLEGVKKTFYDNGKIQEEGFYKDGKRQGIVTWFLQNGTSSMEYTYENGALQGPAKVFDESGRLKLEGNYRNNNEDGEWKEYKDSVLVKKIIYREGQIVKEIPVKK